MDVVVEKVPGPGAADAPLEIVERKGPGHPDTLRDRAAGEACRGLASAPGGAALHSLAAEHVRAILGRLPELAREILDGRHPLF